MSAYEPTWSRARVTQAITRTLTPLPTAADQARFDTGELVSRVNHILRVSGHQILEDNCLADTLGQLNALSLKTLYPSITEEGRKQGTLSPSIPVRSRMSTRPSET